MIKKIKLNRQQKLMFLGLLAILMSIALVSSLNLVSQRQEIRKEAATTTGVTNIRLNPAVGTVAAGGTLSSQIKFNTKGRFISGISVLITYPYSGTTSGLQLTNADIIPDANLTGQNWVFPFKKVELVGNEVRIKIAGYTKALGGYSTGGSSPNFQEAVLAALNFKGSREGIFTLNFSNLETKITEKTSAVDVLLNPVSPAAAYTVSGGAGSQSIDTFQQGLNGYAGVSDTRITGVSPTTNVCSFDSLKVGDGNQYASLIKFNLTSIPAGVIINNAKLAIYANGWSGSITGVSVYRVLRDWEACQTNWSQAKSGINWGTAGCNNTTTDRSETRITGASVLANNPYWYEFDLTSLTQEWVNNSLVNQGVIFIQTSGGSNSASFASSEAGDATKRPKLTVNYQRP